MEAILDTFNVQARSLVIKPLQNDKDDDVNNDNDDYVDVARQKLEFDAIYTTFDDDNIQMVDNQMNVSAEIENPVLDNIKFETDKLTLLLSRYKLLYSCLSYLRSYRKIYIEIFHKENTKISDDLKTSCEILLKDVTIYTPTDLFPEEEAKPKEAASVLSTLTFFKSKAKKLNYKDLTPQQIKQKAEGLKILNLTQKELRTFSLELYKLTSLIGQSLGVKIVPTENENKVNQVVKSADVSKAIVVKSRSIWFTHKPIAESLEEFEKYIREQVQQDLSRDENCITEDIIYTTFERVPESEQINYLNSYYDDWLSEKELNKTSIYENLTSIYRSSSIAIADTAAKNVKTDTKDNNKINDHANPTSQELVERMIKYVCKTIKMGQDHKLTKSILNILIHFLEKGEENDNKKGIIDGVNQFMIEEITKRQITLCNYNIVKMLHELLSSDCPTDVFLIGTQLVSMMLKNGNREIQSALVSRIKRKDSEGKFFQRMKDCFAEASKYINRTRCNNSSDIEEFKGGIDDTILKEVEALSILPMLIQFCEGHYSDAQSILLNQQQFNNQTFNITEAAYLTLFSIVPSIEVFTRLTRVHSEILILLLDFLTELVQGPCVENQNELIRLNIFATCRILLISPELQYCFNEEGKGNFVADPECKPRNPTLILIKAKTMILLSALVEGRLKKELVDDLSSKIEAAVFKTSQHEGNHIIYNHIFVIINYL